MQHVELVRSCIALLRQKFHIGACTARVPLQDTRRLLGVVQQNGVEALDDVPAEHLVALLLYMLRESQDSLIPSELYEQVVNADISGPPAELLSKMSWLSRMESKRLSLLMELLGFLWQAATAESASTTSAKQMATIFAPVLCKPTQAVFNPSQESEDLNRLIDVVAFLIDQFDYLESYARPFELSTASSMPSLTPPRTAWRMQSPTSVISNHAEEMKIVRSLVAWVVGTSLRPSTTPPATDASSGPSTPVERQEASPTVAHPEPVITSPTPATSAPSTPTMPSIPATPPSTANQATPVAAPVAAATAPSPVHESPKRTAVPNRRALLRTCKMLKVRIKKFEEAYKEEHGVLPKQDGDHEMVEIYAEYRRLKRLIREDSATAIQRWFRRHNIRRRLKRARNSAAANETESEAESDGRLSEDAADPGNRRTDRLRELARRKAELKQQLKTFNAEFVKRHNREPEKADKEVIRHLYEEYNAIKSELRDALGDRQLKHGGRAAHDEHKRRRSGDVVGSSSPDVADQSSGDNDEDRIAALTKEKHALHALLKEYEKNFQAKHHRAVFSHDDIVPVAREFERYQEVKQLLATLQPKSRHRPS